MKPAKQPVPQMVAEFIGGHLVAPEIIQDPVTGQATLIPARYDFDGEHAEELERISRAASAASGVVPTPEDLTGQAMAQIQAAAAEQGQAPPGA